MNRRSVFTFVLSLIVLHLTGNVLLCSHDRVCNARPESVCQNQPSQDETALAHPKNSNLDHALKQVCDQPTSSYQELPRQHEATFSRTNVETGRSRDRCA
jgi:hypothetical protein